MNSTLRKEKNNFRENWLTFVRIWEKLNFKYLGNKGKIISGVLDIFLQGFWEINALFSWSKGAQTPHTHTQVGASVGQGRLIFSEVIGLPKIASYCA